MGLQNRQLIRGELIGTNRIRDISAYCKEKEADKQEGNGDCTAPAHDEQLRQRIRVFSNGYQKIQKRDRVQKTHN